MTGLFIVGYFSRESAKHTYKLWKCYVSPSIVKMNTTSKAAINEDAPNLK
jgi:hypothetical protein